MASHFGVTLLIFSVWIVEFTIQDTFDLTDIVTSSCRIGGINHVQDRKKRNFDFKEAEAICRQLGLRIATKPEIEHARSHGFETCSFGWVAERYTVISRIVPNTKCGQNKTGVAIWRQDTKRKFGAYCFNSSDIWKNSCIPEVSTVTISESSTAMNSTPAITSQDTSAIVQTSEAPQTKPLQKLYRLICVTEILTPGPTTMEEILFATDKQTAFKNDGVLFGAVPTVLLVLALIFFAAAVALAICYIKKYKKTFPFSNKEEKKEEIETKNIKETKTSSKTLEQESKNGKKSEEPQVKHEPRVKCLEAEV